LSIDPLGLADRTTREQPRRNHLIPEFAIGRIARAQMHTPRAHDFLDILIPAVCGRHDGRVYELLNSPSGNDAAKGTNHQWIVRNLTERMSLRLQVQGAPSRVFL
jgi:hypothetical protein